MMDRERDEREGYLLVRRVNWLAERSAALPLVRPPGIACPLEDVWRTYRGFDGEAWPGLEDTDTLGLVHGLVPPGDLRLLEPRIREQWSQPSHELLYLRSLDAGAESKAPPLQDGLALLGSDFGYYESEHSHYSALLHELLYGTYDELRQFASRLNAALLFENATDAWAFGRTRDTLLQRGADLETDGERQRAVAVYTIERR